MPTHAERRARVVAAAREALEDGRRLTPSARRVLQARVDHPDAGLTELARVLGFKGVAQTSYAIRLALNFGSMSNEQGAGPGLRARLDSTGTDPDTLS